MNTKFRVWDPQKRKLVYFTLAEASAYKNLLSSREFPVHACTGLKDREGNWIYEKDLVAVDTNHIYAKMMGLPAYRHAMVSYYKGAFWLNAKGWVNPTKGSTLLEQYAFEDECNLYVVGNIHASNHLKQVLPKAA